MNVTLVYENAVRTIGLDSMGSACLVVARAEGGGTYLAVQMGSADVPCSRMYGGGQALPTDSLVGALEALGDSEGLRAVSVNGTRIWSYEDEEGRTRCEQRETRVRRGR